MSAMRKEGMTRLAAVAAGLQECPEHGNTLWHWEDLHPHEIPPGWPEDPREHLACSVKGCDYEVLA